MSTVEQQPLEVKITEERPQVEEHKKEESLPLSEDWKRSSEVLLHVLTEIPKVQETTQEPPKVDDLIEEKPTTEEISQVTTKPELIVEEVSEEDEPPKKVTPPPPTPEECQKKTQELASLVDAQIQIIGAACGKIFEVYHAASRDPKAQRLQGIMQAQDILVINQGTLGKYSTFQQELHVVSKMGKEWFKEDIADGKLLTLLEGTLFLFT